MILALLAVPAEAESWCATPLVVHEWGVEVIRTDGAAPQSPPFPSWFHQGAGQRIAGTRVRDLPADSGIRTLPVLHFYGPLVWGDRIPVGIEVGFTEGEASVWYPQVDRLREPPAAHAEPAPQLVWDALELRAAPRDLPAETDVPWVAALRELDALWVSRGDESERFVFYEADTVERPAVAIERGDTWTPDRPHYVLRNTSDWTVHDVFVVHHGEDGDFAFFAPAIPPGKTAGFLLDAHPLADPVAELRARLVDPAGPPADGSWWADCVMMRDPAVPAVTGGHRLYGPEADALLGVWEDRFFRAPGTTVVYREDTAALDALMPLAVYTDMHHYVDLRRMGLVVWEGVVLP